ncbi:peptidase inhibitor family I36 protein [Streptomyces griseoviridis]
MVKKAVRRLGVLGLGLGTFAGAALIGAPASSAGETCHPGWFCLYEKANFEGKLQTVSNPAEGTCVSTNMTQTDGTVRPAGSFYNGASMSQVYFPNGDCSGKSFTFSIDAGANLPDAAMSFRLFTCESGKVCFWEGDSFNGTKATLEWSNVCTGIGFGANSAWNVSSMGVTTYAGSYCLGANAVSDLPANTQPYSLPRTVNRFKVM